MPHHPPRLPTPRTLLFQVRPDDAFGRQMTLNLVARGCPLLGLPATPSVDSHVSRFTGAGWRRAEAEDLRTVYATRLDVADRARAEAVERLDELEEWNLLQEHYCLALGVNHADEGPLAGLGLPVRAAAPSAAGARQLT